MPRANASLYSLAALWIFPGTVSLAQGNLTTLKCSDQSCVGFIARSAGESVQETDYITVSRKPYECVEGALTIPECKRDKKKIVPLCDVNDDPLVKNQEKRYLFNGSCRNSLPWDYTISGNVIRLDQANDPINLFKRLNGNEDIAAVSIYAIRLEISSPLHLPQTDLTVHAQGMSFRRGSYIDLSPVKEQWKTVRRGASFCPFGTERAKTEEFFKPSHRPISERVSGFFGELASAINTLFDTTREIRLTKCSDGSTVARTEAANGRDGHDGGDFRLYVNSVSLEEHETPPADLTNAEIKPVLEPVFRSSGGAGQLGGEGVDGLSGTEVTFVDRPRQEGACHGRREDCADIQVWIWPNRSWAKTMVYLRHEGTSLGTERIYYQVGRKGEGSVVVPLIPQSGTDAIGEGLPGASGAGGRLWSLTKLPSTWVKTEHGPVTQPRGKKYVGGPQLQCKDLSPGTECKVALVYLRDPWRVTPRIVEYKITDGADAEVSSETLASMERVEQTRRVLSGLEAILFKLPSSDGSIHPYAARAAVAAAKDYYIAGDHAAVRRISELFKNGNSCKQLALSGACADVWAMQARLDDGLDYFGNPAGFVPEVSFQTFFSQYKSVIESYADIMAVALLLRQQEEFTEASLGLVDAQLQGLTRDFADSTANMRLVQDAYPRLNLEFERLLVSSLALQAAIRQYELDLMEGAALEFKDNNRKSAFQKAIGQIAGICKVIPVYQPALAAAATAFDEVVQGGELDAEAAFQLYSTYQTIQDPAIKQQSIKSAQRFTQEVADGKIRLQAAVKEFGAELGNVDAKGEIRAAFQSYLEGTGKSEKSIREAIGNRLQAPSGKSPEAFISDLKKAAAEYSVAPDIRSNALDTVKTRADEVVKQAAQFGNAVSAIQLKSPRPLPPSRGEVQQIFDKLVQNSTLPKLQREVESLVAQQQAAGLALAQMASEWRRLATDLSANVNQRTALVGARDSVLARRDHATWLAMTEIAQRARERMLRYQYQLSKSYEYVFLKPAPIDFQAIRFADKIATIVGRAGSKSLGASEIDGLATLIRAPFTDERERLLQEVNKFKANEKVVPLTLGAEDLERIRKNGYVELDLEGRVYIAEREAFQPLPEGARGLRLIDIEAMVPTPGPQQSGTLTVLIHPLHNEWTLRADPKAILGTVPSGNVATAYFRFCPMAEGASTCLPNNAQRGWGVALLDKQQKPHVYEKPVGKWEGSIKCSANPGTDCPNDLWWRPPRGLSGTYVISAWAAAPNPEVVPYRDLQALEFKVRFAWLP